MKKILLILLIPIFATLILVAKNEIPKGRGEHTYDDIQGMWYVEFNMNWPENYGDTHSHYYIFKGDKMLTLDAKNPDDFHIYEYGFSNSWIIREIDSLMNKGEYFVYKDERGHIYSSMNTYLVSKEDLGIFYDECYYCEDIEEYSAVETIFTRSIRDSINYSKKFLDCDLGLIIDTCFLYDESKNNVLKQAIANFAVVILQDLGDWLEVRYCGPSDIKSTTGYIRREHLQFVVEKEDK